MSYVHMYILYLCTYVFMKHTYTHWIIKLFQYPAVILIKSFFFFYEKLCVAYVRFADNMYIYIRNKYNI